MNNENLGPAEKIIQTLLTYTDHLYHGRTGIVESSSSAVGVNWSPVSWELENNQKVVYKLAKVGKKQTKTKIGTLSNNNKVLNATGREIAEFRPSGLFAEVAVWMYRQISEVYKLDNEFVAKWASYAFGQEHRDLKVVLAAFLLCQNRKGEPVLENGQVLFRDEDYRDVGEAMMLLQRKDSRDLNPKLLMRIHDVLSLPGVAAINRELGFGKSARKPFMGRWNKTVEKWLRYREENSRLLEGLVKAGFRTTVMSLARAVGYKPNSPKFFEILRWKQKQAEDGRRTLAIGQEVAQAESWNGLSEKEICQKIVERKPNFKRLVGMLPKEVGLTRAIVAAAMDAGSLSNKDLVIMTPTLEELGLLQVPEINKKWSNAVKQSEDMRAANIAKNVKSKEAREKLQEGADLAAQKVVEEVTRNMRIYFMVDISGSMSHAIGEAKEYIAKFLQAFPLDRVHVATFNTVGREIKIQHASKAGVEAAFKGISAGGGTSHRGAVDVLAKYKPRDDEDSIFVIVGDEGQWGTFTKSVQESGLRPMAFGLLKVSGENGSCVRDTARDLQIPCFLIDGATFNDVYAIPRTIKNLVASTPVGQNKQAVARRNSLVDEILKTELLKKPSWAA